jgi:gliding motility-associated-like protein
MTKKLTLILICFWAALALRAGHGTDFFLTPNRGQWHDAVHYRAEIPGGFLHLDDQGFTWELYDQEALGRIHTDRSTLRFDQVKMHAVKSKFIGANPLADYETSDASLHYFNYYLGNDSSRWASGVRSFQWVKRKNLYEGIDMKVYRQNGVLKYDLLVAPNADPAQVAIEYEGAASLKIVEGQLHVATTVGNFIEQPPFAYQLNNGKLTRVACHYALKGNKLSFVFPDGYNKELPLVIDPEISFSSYIGSNTSSFGFTASYDDDGNLYAGAIVFGGGYPTSAGAFDSGFNNGTIDATISKFNANGTQLLYSTFLGGSGNESPHSLVVNEDFELYVLGSTGSSNFPATAGVVMPVFEGGSTLNFNTGYGFNHTSGTDIFISKFNADGTALLASTFMGGSENDGIQLDGIMEYNYGDAFRGEIIVDDNSDVYVASVTGSQDFPVSPGTVQATYGGGMSDGCLFKLNADLTNIIWSTYLGGSASDACFSVQLGEDGSAFAAGATRSTDFPTLSNAHQPFYSGATDGFVLRVSPNGQNLTGSTYLGTNFYDEAFFVQLDTDGDVFVVGQTEGDYPVSAGVYNNPNSGQFIQKLNPGLTNSLLSTVVGAGMGGPEISISAFLVSNCDQIYISGWGGVTNVNSGGVATSTTDGMPITPDAFQPNTDGSDFYVMVLSPDAGELEYATFFGGLSNEHVDGGTSRFDKRGTVYQAVCAGCGGGDDFPTQTGVWSEENSSNNANGSCNLGVFKFDLATIIADIAINGPDQVCAGTTVSFINSTSIANQFEWDFGGEGSSSAENPSFVFENEGEYTITMIASDIADCILPDTAQLTITVSVPPEIELSPGTTVCAGDTVQLNVSGGDTYSWSPSGLVSDPESDSPLVWVNETTQFLVTSETFCGSVSDTVTVSVWDEEYGAGDNLQLCPGESVQLSAFGGVSYSWTPAESLSNPQSATPSASPDEGTTYTVTIITSNGCEYTAQQGVSVLEGPPDAYTIETASICDGGVALIWALGGDEYQWDPIPGLSDYTISNPLASPETTTWYYVNVSNICGTVRDSVLVNVGFVTAQINPTDTVCPGAGIPLQASGGVNYSWSPQHDLSDPYIANPVAYPWTTTTYTVVVTDEFGCAALTEITVPVYPAPYVFAMADQVMDYFGSLELTASGNGVLSWNSDDFPLSCYDCPSPVVSGIEGGVAYVFSTDQNGCIASDSVLVEVTGSLFVPNAITPNGDGINDIFKAVGTEIEEFHLQIFNRWGELVFESFSIDEGWNGGVNQHYVENEVYVWHIVAREHTGVSFERRGHVTVIR